MEESDRYDDIDPAEDSEEVLSDSSSEVRTLEVTQEYAGRRLDVFLDALCPEQSRSYLQKMISEGNVLLRDPGDPDGISVMKPGQKVRSGQRYELRIPEARALEILPEDIRLDILYEDSDVIVVNKPKGMVVHPAPGHSSGTLVNALLYHCRGSLSGINGVMRPGIVHRIDRDTTGSLVAAKNDAAHQKLAAQFKVHSITRKYRAIVLGNIRQDEGTVDAPIGRNPADRKKMAIVQDGRRAVTHYSVLERFGQYTYIECELETGRTHQIRVHMAHIGHPLLGDTVYGPSRCPYSLEGQTLHAMVLGFMHPSTGRYMEFTAPLPEYFDHLLEIL